MTAGTSLRNLYEDPSTILSSGAERATRQAEMLAAVAPAQSRLLVVDVGCGDGMCTQVIQKFCDALPDVTARIIGFDWSMSALNQAQTRGIPVVRASADDGALPLPGSSVDIVIMSELIEHLVDPDSTLDEALRVLRPGGSLLLSTPNLAAWYNRALLACGVQPIFTEVSMRDIYGRPGTEVVGHLRIFTRRALRELLSAIGFTDIDIRGAPYHDVPRPLRPLDRLLCHAPGLASNLLASARRPS